MKNLLLSGRAFLTQKQGSIISAAFLIMSFTIASRILGLIRQRVLVHYFSPEDLSVYFAAFFPSETLFEILVAGSLATAFIPVFTNILSHNDHRNAWYVAGITQTTFLLVLAILSVIMIIFAGPITAILTPGFHPEHQTLMMSLMRFLVIAQLFFLMSFFMTGVQESLGRFIVPAIAPLFYNLGIIAGSALLSFLGVWGAAIGAVLGAFLHFAFQLPFSRRLGLRFILKIDPANRDFQKIVLLALPRMIELVALRVSKAVELSLSTLISSAAYTYFIFANTLQLVPVALFGYSFAKASLPTLSTYAARGERESFIRTFAFTVGQILFFVVPFSVMLAVLRIPLVRLAFGAEKFTWEATVQTGLTLSAFSIGIVAQAILAVLTRSFYALEDTRTPMFTALISIALNVFLALFLIRSLGLPVWGIALAFSIAVVLQAGVLLIILHKRIGVITGALITDFGKITFAGSMAGGTMYFLLKVLDQAAWDKRLSFLGKLGLALPTPFQNFVLDTRYTVDLMFLTLLVMAVGLFVYLFVTVLLQVREVELLSRLVAGLLSKRVGFTTSQTREAEIPEPLPPGG